MRIPFAIASFLCFAISSPLVAQGDGKSAWDGDGLIAKLGLNLPAISIWNLDVVTIIHYDLIPDSVKQAAGEKSVRLHEAMRTRVVVSGNDYQVDEAYVTSDGFQPWLRIRLASGDLSQGNLSDNSASITRSTGGKFTETPLFSASEHLWRALSPLLAADKLTAVDTQGADTTIHYLESEMGCAVTVSQGDGPLRAPQVKKIVMKRKNGIRQEWIFEGAGQEVSLKGSAITLPAKVVETVFGGDQKPISRQMVEFVFHYVNSAESQAEAVAVIREPFLKGKFSVEDHRITGEVVRYLSKDGFPALSVVEQMLQNRRFNLDWDEAVRAAKDP